MKKLLLILVAATMTLAGYAAGKGDGSSKADAIEFDWTNGNTQEANTSLWYVVRLAERLAEVEDPNIALYLTNLSSSAAKVDISAIIAGEEEARTYTIAGNSGKTWSSSASMLVKMGYEEMFVKLTTTQQIHLAAKVYEGVYADEACTKAVAYDYAPHSLKAGTNWYNIDLKTLRDNNQGLKITYKATAGTSKIVSMISTDCPSTGLAGLKGSVPNGKEKVHEIPAALIQSMTESVLYLKVENSKNVAVTTEIVAGPTIPVDFSNPTELVWDNAYSITTSGMAFRVALADLLAQKRREPQIAFNNEKNTTETNVKVEIAFKNDAVDDYQTVNVITKEETIIAGETGFMDIARNLLESLDAENCKYVYVRITPAKDMPVSARLKHVREGNACAAAQSVKWNEVIYQDVEFEEPSSTVWYAIDITEPKSLKKDLTITVTNRGEATANITAEVAFECPYLDLQTISRSVEVGKPVSKKVNYTTIATLGSNVVYVGVTTTQPVKVEVVPSDAKTKDPAEVTCVLNDAVPFNWEEGNRQDKDVTVWYSVPADKIIGADYIPEIVVTNEGDKALYLQGELATECPDIYENQARAISIEANGTYSKVIAKDMVKNLQPGQVLYIKLKGNQPFNFRLNKKIENEGASCAKAIPFNWTSGHNQDADVTLWYVLDLDTIQKATGKKVHLTVKNLTGKEATIDGLFAPECPSTTPQGQSVTLKGNQVRTKDVARSTFLAFDKKVYVRLSGSQKFHFEASLVDAEKLDIKCEDMNYTDVVVNKTPTDNNVNDKTGDKAWYRLKVSDVVNAELAPRVSVINGAAAQSIKAYIAYECPVTEEMMNTARSFAANQTLAKTIEQSMVNQIASKYEYVYVLVEGTKDYQFRIDMVDPNTGVDCMHAVEIKKDVVRHHEAGKTKWYKLNVADLIKNEADSKLVFSLTNTDGVAGNVHAAAFTDCEGQELIAGNATIGKNAKREKAVTVEALMGLNTQWLYLQLTSAQAQDLLMTIVTRQKLDPAITACEDAMHFAVNTDYNQNAGESVWYQVNLKEIRENTSGDATLIITNLSDEEITLKAEMAWICPVEYEMTEKSLMMKANEVYTRTFVRDLLNSAEGRDIVYVRVSTDKQMKFRVDMHLSKGDECANPIEFDWVNGNTNPQGACLWYNVEMLEKAIVDGKETDVLRIPEGKDLQLTIVNLSDQKVSASADLRFECKEHSLGDGQYTFEPNETKTKVIDRDLITSVNPTSILVNFCTPKASMYIRADLIDELPDSVCFQDVKLTICDGEVYDDVVTTTVIKHQINAADPATLAWNDTVSSRKGTILVDSIYRFTVTAQIAAEHLDYTTVPDDSKIKANDGETLDYATFEAYLVKYYTDLAAAYDSIAGYDKILWEAFNPEISDFDDINNVPVATNVLSYATTKSLVLAYTVVTTCGSEIYDTIQVDVVKGCDDVFDMTTLDIDWGKAYCGLEYDATAVKKQIQDAFDAAGVKDQMKLYFDLGEGFKEIDNTKMAKDANVKFYAEAISTCDATQKTVSETKTVKVEAPDAKGDQVTNLPLVSELDNWVLVIDLKSINADYDLNLTQGDETEKKVEWYKDGVKIKDGGYYYADNKQLEGGNYYAIITIAEGEDNCGGSWRTEVRNIMTSAPVGVRKQMINGKLYIVTEDNVMYDAQGQKVQ